VDPTTPLHRVRFVYFSLSTHDPTIPPGPAKRTTPATYFVTRVQKMTNAHFLTLRRPSLDTPRASKRCLNFIVLTTFLLFGIRFVSARIYLHVFDKLLH